MILDNERGYLGWRARMERIRAQRAPDPAGYRAHIELARSYERRLSGLTIGDIRKPSLRKA
ncbi:hypothetical protein [Sphingomonas colocasiae]|uniref:Uncharacterized protein n=1 Tax=Sphingomonas colocasiae TaxID=1848973 RepID=A0ABS7PKY4_9SPHN|nr:hypothetical protein [Sphingomonas colocasiae]MBY8821952.1 hypothetical protein [Sphingomonas colocasiae]